jgi:hypothetical protein
MEKPEDTLKINPKDRKIVLRKELGSTPFSLKSQLANPKLNNDQTEEEWDQEYFLIYNSYENDLDYFALSY